MNRKQILINNYVNKIEKLINDTILSKEFDNSISHLMLICAKNKRFIEEEGETLDLKEVIKIIEKKLRMKIVPLFLDDKIVSSVENTIAIVPVFSNQIVFKYERPDLAGMKITHRGEVLARINEEGVFESC